MLVAGRAAELLAVARDVGEGQLGPLGSIHQNQHAGVRLGRELVGVGAVLGPVRVHELGVGGEGVAQVPGAGALRPLAEAGACLDTAAELKPLPPRNWPVKPCWRATVMILAGIPPSEVMKMTSGCLRPPG